MSLSEAAAELGVTQVYLRNAVHRGVLKAKKVGSQWTITTRELERYRAERLGKKGRKKKDGPHP